jgi:hypothetical protein
VAKYTQLREAPPNRMAWTPAEGEEYFPEAAVMLAYALHLAAEGADRIEMHPDGMHVRGHDVGGWLKTAGFASPDQQIAGTYTRGRQQIALDFRSGVGDVVGVVKGRRVVCECKGGVVNTRHPGQVSRLRKGLCEAVGQLLGRELAGNERHVAVVPSTEVTLRLATRMAPRVNAAGIEIALVAADGQVRYVGESNRRP